MSAGPLAGITRELVPATRRPDEENISAVLGGRVPRDAELVFDVRFLRNPHYDPALRPLTGRDPAVAAHVEADPDFAGFWQRLTGFIDPLLPRYVA